MVLHFDQYGFFYFLFIWFRFIILEKKTASFIILNDKFQWPRECWNSNHLLTMKLSNLFNR